MNWISQVGHVAAKDVRRARWALILYLALIAAVLASVVNGRAFGRYSPSPSTPGVELPDNLVRALPFLIVLVGLILSASVLQLDSPTRANAFWASRPLSPSAVLLAKLAVVSIAIVGSSLLAVFTALDLLDATAGATVTMLARSAIAFGEWALAVMVISAITNDLRGAAVSLIAIYLGIFLLPGALRRVGGSATLIGVAGSMSVLVYLYRTRDKRPRTRIAAAVVAACLLVETLWFSIGLERPRPTAAMAAANVGLSLAIDPVNPSTWHSSSDLKMQLRLVSTSTAPGEQLEFRPDTVTIQPVGRDQFNVRDRFGSVRLHRGRLQLGPTIRWIIDEPGAGMDASFEFTVRPRTVDGTSIIGPVASVAIVGTVTSTRSRVIASLPLRVGAAATHGGRRVAMYGFSHDANGVDVWVQTAAISDVTSDHPLMVYNETSSAGGLQFAIFNDARSEAIFLNQESGNARSGSILVLPWIPLSTSSTYFTTKRAGPPPAGLPLDDAWYAGARLVAFDWEVVDRYRVQGNAAVR